MAALAARLLRIDDRPGFLERAVRRQWPLYLFILFLFALHVWALPTGAPPFAKTLPTVFERMMIFVVFTSFALPLVMLYYCGSAKQMMRRGLVRLRDPHDMLDVFVALFAVSFSISTFPIFKMQIPNMVPFIWDEAFTTIDRVLHGGIDPWRYTQWIWGYGWGTVVVDKLYYLWFPVVFVSVTFAALMSPSSVLRNRVIYAHLGAWWVLGIAMATPLSSVGPILHPRLLGDPTFVPLVDALEAIRPGLTTIEIRDMLWNAYLGLPTKSLGGISAMPSLHNALCVLLLLAARHIGRNWTVLATVFCVLIFLGSVHLGWHYAIDGYVAALAMLGVWKGAGWLAERTTPGKA